jgi:hypothetical protein
MRFLLVSLMAALIAVQAPRSASAQAPMNAWGYLDADPDQLVTAAFSTPYGRLLIAEFAAVVAESADATCLKAKGIETSALADRVRAIVLRHGAQFVRNNASAIDRAAFKTNIASRMGAGAEAELAKLRNNNPEVRKLIEMHAPAREAAVVNGVIEAVERRIRVLNFKLRRSFNPLATGDMRLIDADPSDAVLGKLEAFLVDSKSAALTRYLELMAAEQKALSQSFDVKALRIANSMPGLDNDLADVCMSRNK